MPWSSYPMNDVVSWPKEEKIIGIVGVAPLATADFFHKLSSRCVKKDWQHPRVLIDSNPKIPSRGRWLELKETDPVPFIVEAIVSLVKAGASIIALPCNTAHILYPRYRALVDKQVHTNIPDMISITAQAAAASLKERQSPQQRSALILASRQVITNEIYTNALSSVNINTTVHQNQDLVSACIEAVKQGQELQHWRERLLCYVAEQSQNVGVVIVGCTELSVLLRPEDFDGIELIDSNQALADYCCIMCGAKFGMS